MSQMVRRSEAIQELGRPISYYPSLAKIIGVEECVFFCQLMYWCTDGRGKDPEGWIYKAATEWEEETGLSYKRQLTARKRLRTFGIVEEREEKLKHLLYFRINWHRYDDMLERMQVGNSAECRNGIPGNAEQEGRENPKRDSVRTETTAETSSENPNPKPFSGGKGPSSIPSTESYGRCDWRAAARRDPGSQVLATLFPGDAVDWPENLARMFVKRRRAGALPDGLLKLAARSYRITSEDPDNRWKARTIREFLSTARLDKMAAALRRRVKEDVQDLEAELKRWQEDEYGLLDIENIFNLAKSPDFSFPLMFDGNPALTVLFRRGTPEAAMAIREHRDQIEDQLVGRRKILEFWQNNFTKLPPFEEIFGMTVDEVIEMQTDYEERKQKEINDLKSLL